jgi:hypothetical protein
MTDINKSCIKEDNILRLIKDKNFHNHLFRDAVVAKNFETLQFYNQRKTMFGGMRGVFEKEMAAVYGHDFTSMNDIGLFSNLLLDPKNSELEASLSQQSSKPVINSHNRKIIVLNVINITGQDVFKSEGISHLQYNNYIAFIFTELSSYLIENGYYVFLMGVSKSNIEWEREKYIYDMVLDTNKNHEPYISYFQKDVVSRDVVSYLNIIKQAHIVFGIRLHSNIISNSFGIPSVNVSYGIKGANYAITSNLTDCFVPTYTSFFTLQNLTDKLDYIEKNYDFIQQKIEQTKKESYQKYYSEIKRMITTLLEQNKFSKCKILYAFTSLNRGVFNMIFTS